MLNKTKQYWGVITKRRGNDDVHVHYCWKQDLNMLIFHMIHPLIQASLMQCTTHTTTYDSYVGFTSLGQNSRVGRTPNIKLVAVSVGGKIKTEQQDLVK